MRLVPSRALTPLLAAVVALSALLGGPTPAGAFPAYDTGYHSYAEMKREIKAIAAAHPSIVRVFSIGHSYQGRPLWAAKVSDHVGHDQDEPELLFDGGHHAREHISVEMTLRILRWLANGYGSDPAVTRRVNQTETWIVFNLNPDGSQYDHRSGTYRNWRKNRQPTPDSSQIGTDLNRNYGYLWACCGGSSGNPASETYRGPRKWSAPETRAMRNFVNSRVIGGEQQIVAHITFHSFGRLVLWPWAHKPAGVANDADRAVLSKLGHAMANRADYVAEQSYELYVTDGDEIDWMYGRYRTLSFTIELSNRPYLPDERIGRETHRGLLAVRYLMHHARCPYEVIGRSSLC